MSELMNCNPWEVLVGRTTAQPLGYCVICHARLWFIALVSYGSSMFPLLTSVQQNRFLFDVKNTFIKFEQGIVVYSSPSSLRFFSKL